MDTYTKLLYMYQKVALSHGIEPFSQTVPVSVQAMSQIRSVEKSKQHTVDKTRDRKIGGPVEE